jgi:hypothetical protein
VLDPADGTQASQASRSGEVQVASATLRGMTMRSSKLALAGLLLLLAGCGSSSKSQTTAAQPAAPGQASSPGALSAEAKSAATGDIPDTQVFLVFHNATAGYSMKYPEGWTQSGGANDVTYRDKNNLVHVAIAPGGPATAAAVVAELAREKASTPSLKAGTPQPFSLPAGAAIKVIYTTQSAPNSVTGKQVTLTVDRYVLSHAGKRATVDLGSPVGVDNVDAYRKMIQSFAWK